jgi:hypothetical protein
MRDSYISCDKIFISETDIGRPPVDVNVKQFLQLFCMWRLSFSKVGRRLAILPQQWYCLEIGSETAWK